MYAQLDSKVAAWGNKGALGLFWLVETRECTRVWRKNGSHNMRRCIYLRIVWHTALENEEAQIMTFMYVPF